MAVIGSRGVTGTGLIVADPFLASTFFDVMLGGGQAREMQIAMARPYSSLELKLFRQLSDYAAKAFSESLAELIKVEFNVDRLETNPTFVSLGKPTDNAIRLRVQVQFGKRGGLMDLVLPLSLFGAHQVVLKQEEDKETHDHSRWRDHLVQSAAAAELEIEALLAEFKMPLRAVLSLAVGQTLPLHIEPSQAIWIHGGGRRLAVGHIGRSHHHVAVRLAGPIQPISTKRLA
jgi:flagellar motor switch protein FliM